MSDWPESKAVETSSFPPATQHHKSSEKCQLEEVDKYHSQSGANTEDPDGGEIATAAGAEGQDIR